LILDAGFPKKRKKKNNQVGCFAPGEDEFPRGEEGWKGREDEEMGRRGDGKAERRGSQKTWKLKRR
jgi:hypothetical protein